MDESQFDKQYERVLAEKITPKECMSLMNMNKSTYYKYRGEYIQRKFPASYFNKLIAKCTLTEFEVSELFDRTVWDSLKGGRNIIGKLFKQMYNDNLLVGIVRYELRSDNHHIYFK